MTKQKKPRLTIRQYLRAIAKVGATSFTIAPSAGIIRLLDSLIQAGLPIATTYFAALTTTALADAYAGNPDAAKNVINYVLITSGLSIAMLLWGALSGYISQKTRYTITSYIEDKMVLHFSSLPFAMYDDKEVVDLHEKAKRFSYFFSYIFDTIGSMVTGVVGAIGSIAALAFVSPWLAGIVLAAVIPGIVIQVRLARAQAQHWEGNITNRRRQSYISWMLSDSRFIAEMRIYGVVKHLISQHSTLRDQDEKERMQIELGTTGKQVAASILEALVELGALIWIVFQIIDRAQPVGQFLFVQQMVGRAIGDTRSLANRLGQIDEDLANIVDYQKFIEIAEAPQLDKPVEGIPTTIRLRDISFRYPKTDALVLRNISMTIRAGQHIAIVGENGAGKSTLIKILMALYQPTEGVVEIDGQNLAEFQPETWHRQIALLGQDFVTYKFATIRENVQLGDTSTTFDSERSDAAITRAEFDSVVNKLKHGQDTFVERWMAEDNDEATATELSGGQYQRLALARNFYRDSPIIILDEPTSAIDALAEARIFKHLFALQNKTIITISHRLTTVKKADVIYMLKDGKIVEQGNANELIAKKGEFYHMFESQIK